MDTIHITYYFIYYCETQNLSYWGAIYMVYLTWERCSNLVCVGKGDVEKGGMEFPWGVSRIVSIIPRDILTGSPLDRILKYFGNKIGRIAAQSVFNKCHVVRIDLYVYVLYHITLKLPKDFIHALYEYFWDIYTINIGVMIVRIIHSTFYIHCYQCQWYL